MPESGSIGNLISQARQQLGDEIQAHAEQIEKLEQAVRALRDRQLHLQELIDRQLEAFKRAAPAGSGGAQSVLVPLDKLLASVSNLITATLPDQVLSTLAEEAEQFGVRAAVFDIRGKAAWGASARGFGQELSDKAFRALVVPFSKDNPFRQAYETGGHVELTGETLNKKARNVFDKFKPPVEAPILLLPIRSAGSVSALFYSDAEGRGKELPADALKILAEFAGAQLDRLVALSGGLPAAAAERESVETEPVGVAAASSEFESQQQASPAATWPAEPPPPPVVEPPPATHGPIAQPAGLDISQLSEADQKVHRDAKRFAKLLVSEIDLYNKAKVAEGRKQSDLYRRLKADIDRSRQTYEKRFGKSVAKQYDHFHDELVRILAGDDPARLGSDYPGPSV